MLGKKVALKVGCAVKSTGKWLWEYKGPLVAIATGAILGAGGLLVVRSQLLAKR